jgi:hypothetical protein
MLAPLRRWQQRHDQQLHEVEIAGLHHLHAALTAGQGVLITPNHYCFSDPYVLADAADRVGRPFFYMTAWQAIGLHHPLRQLVMRWHGCFSIDRDGPDMQAFRQSMQILQCSPHPLVIFPEGEMYRVSDRVFPFREGPAAIALAAAKRADRQIVCLPAALQYAYLGDTTLALRAALERLEQRLLLRVQAERTLSQRVLRVAEGALALKELDYFGQTHSGKLSDRARRLAEATLIEVENRQSIGRSDAPALSRVRSARQRVLKALEKCQPEDLQREQLQCDLDNLFFVEQLSCYPTDYDAENPVVHRLAETLDKLEEDVLGIPVAPPRGPRQARLVFGNSIVVDPGSQSKESLTESLEQRVQELLSGSQSASIQGATAC